VTIKLGIFFGLFEENNYTVTANKKKHMSGDYPQKIEELPPELMSPFYWQQLQVKAALGEVQHFTPYAESKRFNRN
jgi:hypothetical protein